MTDEVNVLKAVDQANTSVVKSLEEVIILKVRSDDPARFAEVARLCNTAQSFMRANAKRVTDFAVLDEGIQEREPNRLVIQGGGPADGRELERNFMLTFGGNAQVHAEAQRASVATSEATELQSLMAIRGNVPQDRVPIIEARINTLIEHMEARTNSTGANTEPGVVPTLPEHMEARENHAGEHGVADPVVPRGHQAGEGGA